MKFEFAEDRYVVKIDRVFRDGILFIGSKPEAMAYASNLNKQYQTNEYTVEKFDEEKFFKK